MFWFILAYICLPLGIILLVLPDSCTDVIHRLTIPYTRIRWVMSITCFTIIWMLWFLIKMHLMEAKLETLDQKASRWRNERNFWMCATTFFIYFMSLRLRDLRKD